MLIRFIITAIILSGYGQSAAASSFAAPGSGIAAEYYNPTSRENLNIEESDGTGSIKSIRTEAWLRAPIPVAILNGLVTINASLKSAGESSVTQSNTSGDGSLPIPVSSKENRNRTTAGISWHPHHKEGAPRYYLAAERSGLPDQNKTILPFSSYTIGSNIGEDDLPVALNFSATDITETKISLTGHRFSKYNRFEIAAGHRLQTKDGLVLDVMIPRHFLVGYAAAEDNWYVYSGLLRRQEYFPWFESSSHGWSEDLREKKMIGVRIKLFKPLFLVVEAGNERVSQQRYTNDGDRARELNADFAPFARIAIESWHQVL